MNARHVAIAATVMVAAVAAIVSYDHMRQLAERAGESWKSYLIPLAIDGLVVAASTVLVARRRAGVPGGVLAWLALVGGVAASLAANVAAAEPTVVGRAVAMVPPLALAVSFELVRSLISAGHPVSPGASPTVARPRGDALPASGELVGEPPTESPADLGDRAAELVTAGERNGRPVGRRALAKELGITEHQARVLLDRVATRSANGRMVNLTTLP